MVYFIYSDTLTHHGIKGQRWGVKNGPPYPLDASDHSASEKKAGWEKSLDKSKQMGGMSDFGIYTSVFLGIEATMLASALVKNRINVNKGKKFVEQFEKENSANNKTPKSIDSKDINPLKGTMNCGACCISEEMRLRGLSCAAKNIDGMLIEEVAHCFKGATKDSFDRLSSNLISETGNGKETRKNIGAAIAKRYPEGSRGCMFMPMWFGNHYITWEVRNGLTYFRNPQDSKLDLTKAAFSKMVKSGTVGSDMIGIRTLRWDNIEFNKESVDEVLYTDKNSLSRSLKK